MYFTIERAGVLRKKFRARVYGGNDELVWLTQTYTRKEDARLAISFLEDRFHTTPAEVRDLA